jgi:hypothetical protein
MCKHLPICENQFEAFSLNLNFTRSFAGNAQASEHAAKATILHNRFQAGVKSFVAIALKKSGSDSSG